MGLSSQHGASSFVVIKVYLSIVLCCVRRRGPNLDPYLQQWDQICSEAIGDRPGWEWGFVHAISFAVTAIHLIPLIPARLSGHFFCLLSSECARKSGLIMRDQ
jgi:hypothetical protein